MKVKLTEHNFRRVMQDLLKVYEPMPRGQEHLHNSLFFVFDSNMLKLARLNPEVTARHAREAVDLALTRINGYIQGIDYDTTEMENPGNLLMAKALLGAFDPGTNPSVKAAIRELPPDRQGKIAFFEEPFKCLHRLQSSMDFWNKGDSRYGYFRMTEGEIGDEVEMDSKLDFWVPAL